MNCRYFWAHTYNKVTTQTVTTTVFMPMDCHDHDVSQAFSGQSDVRLLTDFDCVRNELLRQDFDGD